MVHFPAHPFDAFLVFFGHRGSFLREHELNLGGKCYTCYPGIVIGAKVLLRFFARFAQNPRTGGG